MVFFRLSIPVAPLAERVLEVIAGRSRKSAGGFGGAYLRSTFVGAVDRRIVVGASGSQRRTDRDEQRALPNARPWRRRRGGRGWIIAKKIIGEVWPVPREGVFGIAVSAVSSGTIAMRKWHPQQRALGGGRRREVEIGKKYQKTVFPECIARSPDTATESFGGSKWEAESSSVPGVQKASEKVGLGGEHHHPLG